MSNSSESGIDRKILRQHENRILVGLVEFYYKHGYTSEAYQDPETGGIYEHKLASKLDYTLVEGKPPPEFITAAKILESQGYVIRLQRKEDSPIKGIWPTPQGLDRAEYLKSSWFGKIVYLIRENRNQVLITVITSVITTLIALLLAWFLGLFGLKG